MNNINTGINISNLFDQSIASLESKGQHLQAQMDKLLQGNELSQEQLLTIQFSMGQYNALIETISTVTKSLCDSMKSIAQRAG